MKYLFYSRLELYLKGLAMGAADLVPGISGGTLAYILGIYSPLIEAIASFNTLFFKTLFSGKFRQAFQLVPWPFLVFLGLGMASAFIFFSHLLYFLVDHPVYHSSLFALFFGLVMASSVFCLKKIKRWSYFVVVLWITGIGTGYASTFFFSHTNLGSSYRVTIPDSPLPYTYAPSYLNYDNELKQIKGLNSQAIQSMIDAKLISSKTIICEEKTQKSNSAEEWVKSHSRWRWHLGYVFYGILGACAMLLPGISGSYLFKILGIYAPVIGALSSFFTHLFLGDWDQSSFMIITSVGLGMILGMALFSRLIIWLFSYYLDATIALMVGFMIGALRAVWPFWEVEYLLSFGLSGFEEKVSLVKPYLPQASEPMVLLDLVILVLAMSLSVFFYWKWHNPLSHEANLR